MQEEQRKRMKSMRNLAGRILVFTAGLAVMALGVALSVRANLGVSPVSCVPYVHSLRFPLTLGTLTVFFNLLLILLQILLLRREYRLFQLVQLPVVLLFGFFIDTALALVSPLPGAGYALRLLLCLSGCAVMGLGVFLEVRADITYLPGEGLALAAARTFRTEFGKAKVAVDSSMVAVGIISSLVLFRSLLGIREGTVIAAVLVGAFARFLLKNLRRRNPAPAFPEPEIRD